MNARAGRRGGGDGLLFVVLACYLLAAAGGAVLVALGAGMAGYAPQLAVRVAGYVGIFLVLTTLPLAILLLRTAAMSRQPAAGSSPSPEMRQVMEAIRSLGEQAALSDDARRVLNRKRERELLCAAIQEDVEIEDWDAAMVLVKELAERFGYRTDAEEFRQRIEQARFETVQRRVSEEMARLDGLIIQRRWDQAMVEAARIGRLYPDSPRVEGLRHRVEHARQLYKADLERRFLMSAEEDRIEEAMELLKELDAYLTEAEAGPYREMARGVIGKARDNLGAQFKLAVQDRRWARAAEIGEQIIDQFPNSRMAAEVRGMLDSIRARAREVTVAGS
jgi:hypothetical protein